VISNERSRSARVAIKFEEIPDTHESLRFLSRSYGKDSYQFKLDHMKYVSATLLYLSIGIGFGAGFGNKINEIDSTILLWVVLIGGSLIISLIIYFIENAVFTEMKFKFIHAMLCIGSSMVLSYFFIITKREYTLLIVFSVIPIAVFFAFVLILSKFLDSEKSVAEDLKIGKYTNISSPNLGKTNSTKMLSGVKDIRDYSESKK
jgi:hypothetical protein